MLGTVGPVPPPVPHVGPVPHVPLVRSSRLGHGHEVSTPKLRLATALMASALRQRPSYLVFFSPILFSEKKKVYQSYRFHERNILIYVCVIQGLLYILFGLFQTLHLRPYWCIHSPCFVIFKGGHAANLWDLSSYMYNLYIQI